MKMLSDWFRPVTEQLFLWSQFPNGDQKLYQLCPFFLALVLRGRAYEKLDRAAEQDDIRFGQHTFLQVLVCYNDLLLQ